MTPSTTVVICSRGRPQLLVDAVRSVLAMDHLPDELVVVDQSDEPQPDLAAGTVGTEGPVAVTYLWRPDRGLSRARNVALAAARGDVVALLDDDMYVARDWLDAHLRALTRDDDDRVVVTGQVRSGDPEHDGAWAPSTLTSLTPRTYTGPLRQDVLWGGNMAMYRSVVDEVGRFDERLGPGSALPSAEDNDFGYRLLRAGYAIRYEPTAVAVHRSWRREGARARLKYDYGRGQGAFYTKHLRAGDRTMLRRLAGDSAGHLRRAVARVVHLRPGDAVSDVTYTVGLAVGALGWLRRR